MRRRDFVTFVGRAAAVWPLVAKIADTADACYRVSQRLLRRASRIPIGRVPTRGRMNLAMLSEATRITLLGGAVGRVAARHAYATRNQDSTDRHSRARPRRGTPTLVEQLSTL